MGEVFVTGCGVVSAFGVGNEGFRRGLALGQRAASRPVEALDGTCLEGQEAGAIPGLEAARATLSPKLRKFLSEAALLGCLAGREAWEQAGLAGRVDPGAIGLFAASGLTAADYEASRELLEQCIGPDGAFSEALLGSRGLGRMNPLDSFRILPNMPPCFLAMLLGIQGPSLVFNPFEDQGAAALVEGIGAVARGEVAAALVGAADTPSVPASLVYLRQSGQLRAGEWASPAAAYLVLEPRPTASALARITLHPGGAWRDPCAALLGRTFAAAPALASAAALAAALGDGAEVALPGCTLVLEPLP